MMVGPWARLNNAAPSLQPHYRAFVTTTGCSAGPCAPHRYSGPRGFSHLDVSLGVVPEARTVIGATGSHVPYESLMRARAVFTPDAARSGPGHPSSLSRENGKPPVSTSSNPLSTLQRRFARARLPAPCLPGSSSRRFCNAHHRRSLRQQLAVAWSLLLIAGSEGPSLISRTVAHPRVDRRCS